MIEKINSFTYAYYIAILKHLKKNYTITSFNHLNHTSQPYVILRHDIDASLDYALDMARLENSLGISSTYFILFSHKLYNVFEKESYNKLLKISNLGHEIGLHYDLSVYDAYDINYNNCLDVEIQLLKHLIKKEIRSISIHNPTITNKQDPFRLSDKYLNAYDNKFFDLYVSDSCRSWYINDIENLFSSKYDRIQLVIHPFLWKADEVKRKDVLEALFSTISSENEQYKCRWMHLWESQDKVISYENVLKRMHIKKTK